MATKAELRELRRKHGLGEFKKKNSLKGRPAKHRKKASRKHSYRSRAGRTNQGFYLPLGYRLNAGSGSGRSSGASSAGAPSRGPVPEGDNSLRHEEKRPV